MGVCSSRNVGTSVVKVAPLDHDENNEVPLHNVKSKSNVPIHIVAQKKTSEKSANETSDGVGPGDQDHTLSVYGSSRSLRDEPVQGSSCNENGNITVDSHKHSSFPCAKDDIDSKQPYNDMKMSSEIVSVETVHPPTGYGADDFDFDQHTLDMFQQTAMSLDLDNSDLLFNLMYFGGGGMNFDDANMGRMVNSALEETVALYSENNTPYKLNPVSNELRNSIEKKKFTLSKISENEDQVTEAELSNRADHISVEDCECSVCKEMFVEGEDISLFPKCHHKFHGECLDHWLNMVRQILSDG